MNLRRFAPENMSINAKYFLTAMMVSGLGDGIIMVISQLYFVSHGFTSEQLANIGMFKPIGTALITLPAGILADRLGKRKILVSGFSLFIIGFLMLLLTTNTTILSVALFLIGLSDAAYVVLNPLYSSFFEKDDMDKAFGLMMFLNLGAVSMGSLLGFIPSLLVNNLAYTYQQSYWLMLAASFIFFTIRLPLFLLSSREADATVTVEKPRFTIISKDIIAKFAVITLIGIVGYETFFSLLPYYLNTRFSVQSDAYGSLIFIIMLVSAVSNIFSAQISGKLGTTKTIILSYALSIPFYLMIALSPGFTFASTMIISRVAIINLGSPLMQSLFMRNLQPGEKSTGSSVIMMVQRIAQAFAAWLGGQLMSKVGLNSPIFLGVGLYVLFTVVAQVLLTPLDNGVEATVKAGGSIVKAAID